MSKFDANDSNVHPEVGSTLQGNWVEERAVREMKLSDSTAIETLSKSGHNVCRD
jgi:hypothetical protein